MTTSLAYSDDQQMLADIAANFVRDKSPIGRIREYRDKRDPLGFSSTLWRTMADLGWPGIAIPEEYGGSGLGLAELAIVIEALGRSLAPEPMLSSAVLCGQALAQSDNRALKQEMLPLLCSGDACFAFAVEERSSRYDCLTIDARAERDGHGWRLTGEKHRVLDGGAARYFILSANCGPDTSEPTLFLVPADADGISVETHSRLDHRKAARVGFHQVQVDDSRRLTGARLDSVLDWGFVALSAEMLGLMSEAFDRTVAYLKARVQFDAPIGSFQALQHRAAICYVEIELARSVVLAAARALDAKYADAPKLASAAKARCSDAAIHITNEALQMHGGIGMTDECDIGLFLKRARAAAQTFGDGAWHRDRFARLSGF